MAKKTCNAIIQLLILQARSMTSSCVAQKRRTHPLQCAFLCYALRMWCVCCFCYPCDGPTPLGVNESEEIMQILLSAPRHPLYETKNLVETLGGAEKRQEAHVGSSAINTCKTSEALTEGKKEGARIPRLLFGNVQNLITYVGRPKNMFSTPNYLKFSSLRLE